MTGRENPFGTVAADTYREEELGRFLPRALEVGEPCIVRLDLSAFDRDGVPGVPTLAEFSAVVKAKLHADDWTMLVVNNANHKGTELPTDYRLTFDPMGLLRHFDDGPLNGDGMASLNRAIETFFAFEQPGGYVLPLGPEVLRTEIDADLAQLLGGSALSGQ